MAKNQRRVGQDKSPVIAAIPAACADEAVAVAFLEKQRWANEPCCPKCGSVTVYQMTGADGGRQADFRWRCRDCKQQYTVRTGTVLEDSRIPLRHWCYAFWRAATSKKGVSALEIKRHTGLSYKSALFLMHRVRFAMTDAPDDGSPLCGDIEVDETYIGGKPRKGGPKRRPDGSRPVRPPIRKGRGTWKPSVVAMVEREGRVRASHIANVCGASLGRALRANVDRSAIIYTDELKDYRKAVTGFAGHRKVQHNLGVYADGDVTTNTVESFFALLKRGIIGTFHTVSAKHLHRYVDEFGFRWNGRKLDDGARLTALIRGANHKRLTYAQQIAEVQRPPEPGEQLMPFD